MLTLGYYQSKKLLSPYLRPDGTDGTVAGSARWSVSDPGLATIVEMADGSFRLYATGTGTGFVKTTYHATGIDENGLESPLFGEAEVSIVTGEAATPKIVTISLDEAMVLNL